MFSQSVIDSMSVNDLVKRINSLTNSINNTINDDAEEALFLCNNLINLATELSNRIEEYIED